MCLHVSSASIWVCTVEHEQLSPHGVPPPNSLSLSLSLWLSSSVYIEKSNSILRVMFAE